MGTLWNTKPGDFRTPLDDMSEVSPERLEEAALEMIRRQKTCEHVNRTNYAPSYFPRFDGSWGERRSYFCHDCGYSESVIG